MHKYFIAYQIRLPSGTSEIRTEEVIRESQIEGIHDLKEMEEEILERAENTKRTGCTIFSWKTF